jgi:raffinose/stachyose/melibiose transport system permease protein
MLVERRAGFWRRLRKHWGVYLFIAPSIILILLFNYYPALSAFVHSLYDWDGVNAKFVGFGNFQAMPQDDALMASLPNILLLTIAGVVFAVTLPLIGAEFIFNLRSRRLRYWYRVIFVVPMIVPWIVTVLVWRFLYDPIDGPINKLLAAVGLGQLSHAWLAEPQTAIYAIMLLGLGGTFVGFPFVAGLNLLIYLAGLDGIPGEILEAARLDGATGFRRFLHLDLPLLTGQLKLIVILTVITQIQGFQTIILLTQGGPGYSTTVPGWVMYQNAFQFSRMGYASAIGVAIFVVVLVFTAVNMRFIRSSVEYEA